MVEPTYRGGGGVQGGRYIMRGDNLLQSFRATTRCLQVAFRLKFDLVGTDADGVAFNYFMTKTEADKLIHELQTATWAKDIR